MILKVSKKAQKYFLDNLEFAYYYDKFKDQFSIKVYYWFGPVRVYQRTRKFAILSNKNKIENDEVVRFKSNLYLWNEVIKHYEN